MRRLTVAAAIVAVAPAMFAAQTPAQAIAAGRAAIEAKQFDRAIVTLQDAIPAATMLPNGKEKSAALAAIHFYSALAFSELERDDKTREELREFFRFQPNAKKLDETKYPVPFVRAFNELAERQAKNHLGGANSFEAAYPGFNEFVDTHPRNRKLSEWSDSAAYQLLATPEERREWDKLADDAARAAFIQRFWERRDPTQGTERNEYREEFERRAAFADENFGSERGSGSLSDRGRVLILVGVPYRVTLMPLNGSRVLPSRRLDGLNRPGTIERWTYNHDQLPAKLPVQQLDFTFVDEPGYGDFVLQRDGYTIKELHDAARVVASR
jgi:GWxTD domain-containing protein